MDTNKIYIMFKYLYRKLPFLFNCLFKIVFYYFKLYCWFFFFVLLCVLIKNIQ